MVTLHILIWLLDQVWHFSFIHSLFFSLLTNKKNVTEFGDPFSTLILIKIHRFWRSKIKSPRLKSGLWPTCWETLFYIIQISKSNARAVILSIFYLSDEIFLTFFCSPYSLFVVVVFSTKGKKVKLNFSLEKYIHLFLLVKTTSDAGGRRIWRST